MIFLYTIPIVIRRRGRRHKQLLDDLKERRGHWKLKVEAPDRTLDNSLWKTLRTCRKKDNRVKGRSIQIAFPYLVIKTGKFYSTTKYL